jgi:hypothetical protein
VPDSAPAYLEHSAAQKQEPVEGRRARHFCLHRRQKSILEAAKKRIKISGAASAAAGSTSDAGQNVILERSE